MILPFVGALCAFAADDPTYARLFGSEGSAESAPAEAPSPWRLAGPLALAAVGAGAAWYLRRQPVGGRGRRPMAVVWREPVGSRSMLLVVDVLDADGEKRRLLVGTGGGPPALVADLGAFPVAARPASEEDDARVPPRTRAEAEDAIFRARARRPAAPGDDVPPGDGFSEHAARRGLT